MCHDALGPVGLDHLTRHAACVGVGQQGQEVAVRPYQSDMQGIAVAGINARVALVVIHAVFGRLAAGGGKAFNLVFQIGDAG